MSQASTHDENILAQHLDAQAQKAPDPTVRIREISKQSYTSDGYARYGTLVDFDLMIPTRDLLAHRAHFKLVSDSKKAYRGTRIKVDALSNDLKAYRSYSLKEWYHDFSAYKKGPKRYARSFSMSWLPFADSCPQTDSSSYVRLVPSTRPFQPMPSRRFFGVSSTKAEIKVTVEVQDQKTALLSDHVMARIRRDGFLLVFCCIFQLWIALWLMSKR